MILDMGVILYIYTILWIFSNYIYRKSSLWNCLKQKKKIEIAYMLINKALVKHIREQPNNAII